MSQWGDQNDIFVYVLNVFIGIAIAVYFLPCKKKSPCRSYFFMRTGKEIDSAPNVFEYNLKTAARNGAKFWRQIPSSHTCIT